MRSFTSFKGLLAFSCRPWLGAGLAVAAQFAVALPAQAQQETAEVVINPDGGNMAGDGLRLHLGTVGGMQVVREGEGQLYDSTDTPADGGVGNTPVLSIGDEGSATVCGHEFTSFTPVSQTAVTGLGTNASPYQATTVMACGDFLLRMNYRYVVPKDYFEIRVAVLPPRGNTQSLRFSHWLDTYLNGGDNGPAFWQPDDPPLSVLGVTKAGQYEVIIQGNRAWNSYYSGYYLDPYDLLADGGALDGTLDTDPDTDNGFAVQWLLGAPSSPVKFTYRMALTQVAMSSCGNGSVEGFEACDDGDVMPGDGCSDICQQEVGYVCQDEPSDCRTCFEDVDCDDSEDCTVDSCVDNECEHGPAEENTECFGGFCNAEGDCLGCNIDANCDDSNECTSDDCDAEECTNTPVEAGTACETGFCNGSEEAPACVGCLDAADCDDLNECTSQSCDDNTCVFEPLEAGTECSSGVCDGEESPACVGCLSSEDCGGGTPFCNLEELECVECLIPDHCDDDNLCSTDSCNGGACRHVGMAGAPCAGGVCSARAPSFACVACISDSHCADPTPLCDGSGRCVGCLKDTDCTTAGAGHCGPTRTCVACESDTDCDDGNSCTSDTCSSGSCRATALPENTACDGGTCWAGPPPICAPCRDTSDGGLDEGCSSGSPVCAVVGGAPRCTQCENDQTGDGVDHGCDAASPFCSTGTHTCAACMSNDDCSSTERCSVNGSCQPPCAQDADCDDGLICARKSGRCVECVATADCAGRETCADDGRCTQGDFDDDRVADDEDLDDDNDGLLDEAEYSTPGLSGDTDGDGVLGYQDPDAVDCTDGDGDGVCDGLVSEVDQDGDGTPNHLDRDADGDTIPDIVENDGEDSDGDGAWDPFEDANGDGVADDANVRRAAINTDGDRLADYLDVDTDEDARTDVVEASDANHDGRADRQPSGNDADADGFDDAFDTSQGGRRAPLPDGDRDGTPDWRDSDGTVAPPGGEGGDGGGGGAAPPGTDAGEGGGSATEGGSSSQDGDSESDDGCSCRLGTRQSQQQPAGWLIAALGLGLLAQRRRGSPRRRMD